LGQTVPYRSANQALVDISELGLVRGFDQASVAILKPFVSALPQPTKINVNSANIDLLMALSDTIGVDKAEQLIINRNNQYWRTSAAFIEAILGPKGTENQHQWSTLAELVTVDSHYFKLNVAAQFGVAKIHLESNLHRGNNGHVTVLSRIYTP
jgi:general secretion pathway protein K